MGYYSHRRKPPGTKPPLFGDLPVADAAERERHASHRTRHVRIRGLVLNPPGANGPVEVCVNHQADWELIYKHPSIQVKCLVESCETLLTAKQMRRSGLRFLAVRVGGCSHNLVATRVDRDDVEQDPHQLAGGGGPEGDEHLWMKATLFKIAQSLGAEAVVEHSLTRADVFLPGHDLALEYQRWNTDFLQRTEQRSSAGVAHTVWMFPWQPPNTQQTSVLKAFNNEVFEHGGMFIAVRNEDDARELQRPWEDASQERTARLYASGSIAVFDIDRAALIRKERPLETVLAEILAGDRVLAHAVVLTKSNGQELWRRVWALRADLARAEAAQEERRRARSRIPGAEQQPELPVPHESRSDGESAAEKPKASLPLDDAASGAPAEFAPISAAAGTSNDDLPAPVDVAHDFLSVSSAALTGRPPNDVPAAPRTSWFSSLLEWFRRL